VRRRDLRAKGPGDLLAVVPELLGFHPTESLVMVTVGDATDPVHARVDLPVDDADADAHADHLTAVARRNGVARAAVVAYGRDAERCTRAGSALGDRLLDAGIDVVCALRADGSRWWVLGGSGPGERYDLATHPLTAQSVLDGAVVLGSREELEASLDTADDVEVERVRELVAATDPPTVASPWPVDRTREEESWVQERVRRFLADGVRLSTEEVARLVSVAACASVRDAASSLVTRVDARRHVDLWRDVVRRTPVGLRAEPAGLLAFAAWLAGDGALAWCAVERALADDPGHRLSGLVASALERGVPPSAWLDS